MENDTNKKTLGTPFEDAGLSHHALVGKAPDGSGAFYRAAVKAGNIAWTVVGGVMVAGQTISGQDNCSFEELIPNWISLIDGFDVV